MWSSSSGIIAIKPPDETSIWHSSTKIFTDQHIRYCNPGLLFVLLSIDPISHISSIVTNPSDASSDDARPYTFTRSPRVT